MALVVEEIEDGTVIDHIPAGKGLQVLKILDIEKGYTGMVALVINAKSKKLKVKDIVKIAGRHMTQKVLDQIAIVAPTATINLIKDYKVIEKRKVVLPKKLVGVCKCPNPKCITNQESITTVFEQKKDVLYSCHYCERFFKSEELIH